MSLAKFSMMNRAAMMTQNQKENCIFFAGTSNIRIFCQPKFQKVQSSNIGIGAILRN